MLNKFQDGIQLAMRISNTVLGMQETTPTSKATVGALKVQIKPRILQGKIGLRRRRAQPLKQLPCSTSGIPKASVLELDQRGSQTQSNQVKSPLRQNRSHCPSSSSHQTE